MLSVLNRLNLIRYLIVWRVNRSLVFFPRYFSIDLSAVIGTIISNRLPTKDRIPWKKALKPLTTESNVNTRSQRSKVKSVSELSWPIRATLFVYPGKRTYGRDELIFWELKLWGEHADHGLFLEVILPAMEEASYTSDTRWNRRNRIWGHFDIQNVFVARGSQWEPIVTDCRLDLRYQPRPNQWLDGLQFTTRVKYPFRRLHWMSPFDLSNVREKMNEFGLTPDRDTSKFINVPTLPVILIALIFRIHELLNPKSSPTGKISTVLDDEERGKFQDVLQKAATTSITRNHISKVPSTWPGKWLGAQRFSNIPRAAIPYLELASILHVGKQTHFGCGTFVINQ